MIISSDFTFEKNAVITSPVIIAADSISIDGNGATIAGPGINGSLDSFQGNGIFSDGCSNVTIKNIRVRGFESGFLARNGSGWIIENCDFSDNFTNPAFGWGEYKNVGGIILENINHSVIRTNRASNVWNALDLVNCSNLLVDSNDFSRCSNVCLKLWESSYNRFSGNNLSYGLRIDPGEVHARDSAGVLVENNSDFNAFSNNDITHGGDGVFIRALNGCVSRGNVFIENDCSHAHNNGFEAWCPDNTYIRNKANYCSFGFWLGGSDNTVLIGNEAAFNGSKAGLHNASESDFGHGGIVAVGGSSSHTIIRDNFCHDNTGGGIVLRGENSETAPKWRSFHWIIQNNRLERNKWPVFARVADMIFLSGNSCIDNQNPSLVDDVLNCVEVSDDSPVHPAPHALLLGPSRSLVGSESIFDASASCDPAGLPLSFQWHINGVCSHSPVARHVFSKPGFYRVALTVNNGSSADMAFKDVYVVDPQIPADSSWQWSLSHESADSLPVLSQLSAPGICSPCSLQVSPRANLGGVLTGVCDISTPVPANASSLVFWLKFKFSCISEFRGANPVVSFVLPDRTVTFEPVTPDDKERNLFLSTPFSEARWGWQRVVVPFNAGSGWKKVDQQPFAPENISAVTLTVTEPLKASFDLLIDGFHFE